MKKIIKLSIENTTQIRKTEDSLCELYSHDKNNGVFEFEVVNETLGNEKPYAMFKFMDSQSVWKVPGTIEDNKIKILFDTTLITQDETVVCFLYLDDEERTTDFYRFKFKVKVSEIDKLDTYAVKERYFNNSIIVDKVDVVTKKELEEALKGLTVSSVEGVLTETRADELYAKKSEIYDDTALKQRVATLEERPDNNTVYDDSDLRGRVIALESKADNDTVYDDTDLKRRVSELEQRPDNNTVYDDTDVKERLANLETKVDKDTVYDDSDLKRRVSELEQRPDNNTVYDDTALSNRVRALEDAPKVDVTNFATKDDVVAFNRELNNKVSSVDFEAFKTTIPASYNDSDLRSRVETLETKQDKDTVYNDEPIKERLIALESKPFDDYLTNKSLEGYAKKTDLPVPYNDKVLSDRVLALENKTITNQTLSIDNNTLSISGGNSVELPSNKPLTGNGSPEGNVIANPGDTYVNKNVSLGDYLYYKERNPGKNTGWKVLYGSMGVNINLSTGGRIRFQRENYFVNASISDLTISLDALNSGQGRDFYQDGENVVIRFIPSKQFDARESIIPQGFRPSGNFLVPAYSKSGDSIGLFKFEQTYGIVKLILNDVNKDNVTSEMLKGINSGLIVYPTQEAWMVRLP